MRRTAVLARRSCAVIATACAFIAPASAAEGPTDQPCPDTVPTGTRCAVMRDSEGAYVWFAMPKDWNRVLVVHAHGGPELGPPEPKRGAADLQRWSVMVKAGYAWVGSTYRRGGYGVRMAAEDTVRARKLFLQHFDAHPRRIVLHGQSWGGNVAAKTAELFQKDADGKPLWDGLLLTSGVLGGGTQSYDVRLDLRVVYQALCHNHPKADEPQYPLWQGLPMDSKLTRAELSKRMDQCLGLHTPAAQRTSEQQRKLDTLLEVTTLPERTLQAHMNWATWLFQDLVQLRLGGHNPFGNEGVRYRGSPDDDKLNAEVLRYKADPLAVAQLADDSDLTGRTTLPTVTLHAIDDPTAFVELESVYREAREQAGTADHLVQNFSDEHEHSFLSPAEYPALMTALLQWIDEGRKPTPQGVLALCHGNEARFGAGCPLQPDYQPRPLSARVPAR
jgi:alpha-beta hydrolase superfamily lysophospholipase